jgi:hypothetical protein
LAETEVIAHQTGARDNGGVNRLRPILALDPDAGLEESVAAEGQDIDLMARAGASDYYDIGLGLVAVGAKQRVHDVLEHATAFMGPERRRTHRGDGSATGGLQERAGDREAGRVSPVMRP